MKISVLDKGYIELVDTLGDDLTPVNVARVSFGGRSNRFSQKDRRLSKFLIQNKHFSLGCCFISFLFMKGVGKSLLK